METQITISVPHDFELLCLVLTYDIADVIQDYVDRISLPKLLSQHPDDPSGGDMFLFLYKTESQDPKRIVKRILKFYKTDYRNDLKSVMKLDLEQPEREAMLRVFLNKWRPKIIEYRRTLREKTHLKFKIVGYDN